MTAYSLKSDRERCLDAGMNDYTTKPIKAAKVRDMIDKWIGHTHVEPPARQQYTPTSGSDENQDLATQTAIDIEKALSQLEGDRDLLYEALDVFLDTSPALLEDLQSAASAGDGHKLQHAAHSLKGAASNLCAEPVRSVAQQLEEMGRRGELAGVDTVIADLRDHLERLRESVENLEKD